MITEPARPKVLFTSHSGAVSGAERVLLDLVVDWPDASAFVFEPGDLPARLAEAGLNVQQSRNGLLLAGVRRGQSPLSALPMAGRIAGITAELVGAARRADLIYANSQKAFTLSAVAARIARRPLIWHLHDILDASHFGAGARRMQVLLANRCAACVVVPSEAAAAAFVASGGRRALIRVIPNGRAFVPDPRGKAELRRDLGLAAGPLVGVFSRLAAWKGQDVLLRALAQVDGVTGVLVGSALFGEEAFEASLKQLATDLGIADRVSFLGQRSDVAPLMQAMDLMVHPSIDPEPFGLTLVEAMQVSVPVIASAAGAAPEILDDGRCGTLVPPGDASALAEAIRQSLAAPEALASRTAAALTRANTLYAVAPMRQALSETIGRVSRRAAA